MALYYVLIDLQLYKLIFVDSILRYNANFTLFQKQLNLK